MGRFLKRGESKDITLYLNDRSYKAKITNVNFDSKFNRKKDTLQIRYPKNGTLAKSLQGYFSKSYQFVESHHIDYFVASLNNDARNQLIVCPNHHSIIHDTNPVFDRRRLLYIYKNGLEQRLMLNQHL